MEAVISSVDRKSCVATLDVIGSPEPEYVRVPCKPVRRCTHQPVLGRLVRFVPTGQNIGVMTSDVCHSAGPSHVSHQVPFRATVCDINARYVTAVLDEIRVLVALRKHQVTGPQGSAGLKVGAALLVYLDSKTSDVMRAELVVAECELPSSAASVAAPAEQPSPAVCCEAEEGSCEATAVGASGALRVAAQKFEPPPPTSTEDCVRVKKEESDWSADDVQRFCEQATSGATYHIGTWSVAGFDPSFFFPPQLSIRVVHDAVTFENNTPPVVHQHESLLVELLSYWTLPGTAVDLRVVDMDGVDVTSEAAMIHILVPDSVAVVTLDSMAPQVVCTFEITWKKFEIEDICEIALEVTAAKAGVRRCDSSLVEQRSSTGNDEDRDETQTVRAQIISRSVFVRSAKDKATRCVGERMKDKNSLSHTYWARNVLQPHESVAACPDGFTDPGRSNALLKNASEYLQVFDESALAEREVIVIEKGDAKLAALADAAAASVKLIADTRAKASVLLWFVATAFGRPADRRAECTSVTKPTSSGIGGRGGRKGVDSRKRSRTAPEAYSAVLPLGNVENGLCRHRSLLFKYLCDLLVVPCYLVRGEHRGSGPETDGERHSWNVVVVGHELLLADAMLSPQRLLPWPDASYVCQPLLAPPFAISFVKVKSTRKAVHVREECGRGACASVRRCVVGGMTCAIKLPRRDSDIPILQDEYDVLSDFDGVPHIVQTFGRYKNGILLEHYPMSLLAFMNMLLLRRSRLSHGQIKDVVKGVLSALVAVHARGYVHRDVKAENILVNAQRCRSCVQFGTVCNECSLSQVALADFADCYHLGAQLVHSGHRVGTAPYAAPEIEHELEYSFEADVWSVGILTCEMMLMQLPTAHNNAKGKDALLATRLGPRAVFVPSAAAGDPSWYREVLRRCLILDWRGRPTAKVLLEILGGTGESNSRKDEA